MKWAVVVAVLTLVAAAPANALDASSFRWERTLETDGGLAAFEPDGPMYEHAAAGFRDLRVLDARGRQVGWRTRSVRGDEQLRSARILNAGTQSGAAVALLDFGPERVVRERIQLNVPQQPFVGRAEVHGSHDRKTYTRLSSTAIYDVRGATRAISTVVVFPPSDFRYYRIRATGVKAIRGATAEAVAAAGAPVQRSAEIVGAAGGLAHGDRRGRGVSPGAGARAALRVVDTLTINPPVNVYGSMDGKTYVVAGGGRLVPLRRRRARRRSRSTAATGICGSGSGTGTTSRSATSR